MIIVFNENLKSTTKSENKYKDRIMFDPFLMPKFIKDLGGSDDDIDEVMGNSSVLYYVNNNIYFGELTFIPGAGYSPFEPESANMLWGEYMGDEIIKD